MNALIYFDSVYMTSRVQTATGGYETVTLYVLANIGKLVNRG